MVLRTKDHVSNILEMSSHERYWFSSVTSSGKDQRRNKCELLVAFNLVFKFSDVSVSTQTSGLRLDERVEMNEDGLTVNE